MKRTSDHQEEKTILLAPIHFEVQGHFINCQPRGTTGKVLA